MAVNLTKTRGEWTLSLSGVVDVTEAGALHSMAGEAARSAHGVVVRLDEVAALDASVTQLLLALQQSLAADGRVFRVERVPPRVGDLWRGAGFADRLG